MTFRDTEKKRYLGIKENIWNLSPESKGNYGTMKYDFCLPEKRADENIFEDFRDEALQYFKLHNIEWHDGNKILGFPSTHLCCSQSCCINTWFSFIYQPEKLKNVLIGIGYEVKEVLPVYLDIPFLENNKLQYVAFEWIGELNYLGELLNGKKAAAYNRTRGSGFTSADFIIRFLRPDGKIQIVLGEWKYTEYYEPTSIQISKRKTDRLEIYRPYLEDQSCPIKLLPGIILKDLFYDPFDQMMRLQLLAAGMEKRKEMQADIVSVLHISPRKNTNLNNNITSNAFKEYGNNIHDVWAKNVLSGKFNGLYLEELKEIILNPQNSPSSNWSDYYGIRYNI
jgi:hypothetical protein